MPEALKTSHALEKGYKDYYEVLHDETGILYGPSKDRAIGKNCTSQIS